MDHTSLEVSNLTVNYGAVTAVRNVTIKVPEGRTVTILGANGAGKSSILRAAMGLTPSGGSVKF